MLGVYNVTLTGTGIASCLTLTFISKWQAWNICCGGVGSWHVVMISLRGYIGFMILASRHWHSNVTFGKWVICLNRGFVSCKWSHEFPCIAHTQSKFYTCTRLLIISSCVLNNYSAQTAIRNYRYLNINRHSENDKVRASSWIFIFPQNVPPGFSEFKITECCESVPFT